MLKPRVLLDYTGDFTQTEVEVAVPEDIQFLYITFRQGVGTGSVTLLYPYFGSTALPTVWIQEHVFGQHGMEEHAASNLSDEHIFGIDISFGVLENMGMFSDLTLFCGSGTSRLTANMWGTWVDDEKTNLVNRSYIASQAGRVDRIVFFNSGCFQSTDSLYVEGR